MEESAPKTTHFSTRKKEVVSSISNLIILVSLMLSIMTLCSGCLFVFAGRGDWHSKPLVDDYVIIRSSAEDIILGKGDNPWETIVDAKITYIAWNDLFICVQRTDKLKTGEKPIIDGSPTYYYIVSISDSSTLGPLTKQEFYAQCETLGVGILCEWTDVETLPRSGS